MAELKKEEVVEREERRWVGAGGGSHGRALLCPYEFEDPAFRRAGRLPNLRYGDQVRAVWVTRYDFESDADIIKIMQRSAQSGFNTVFFQVRGNGTAYYSSELEPWSETFDWRSPGYDPLLLAIQEAHSRNMALHAWINVMPMWRGSLPPSNKDHMYWTHPEWSWYDQHGARQPLNRGFYVSINPCLPEARNHIVQVCRELVSFYEIDGLHLDYIRFPNEQPVVNGHAYPRDKRTLGIFQADTGFTVEEKPNLWDQWRSDCVTALLRDVRLTAKSIRPQIVLTAAVGAERLNALGHFQDVERWWKERLLDAVVPMNYTGCHRTFRRRVEREWLDYTRERLILPLTRMLFRHDIQPENQGEGGPEQLLSDKSLMKWSRPPKPAIVMGTSLEFGDTRLHQKQLALALQRFGHFSVFSYSSLFVQNREETLRPLLLFLRILADASGDGVPDSSYRTVHPFRARTTYTHPEEAQLCEPQHIDYDIRSHTATFISPQPAAVSWRSRRKGRRFTSGVDGGNEKNNRRTVRRGLLVKDMNKKGKTKGKEKQCEFNLTSLGCREDDFSPSMEMNEWEAARMSEATMREELQSSLLSAEDALMNSLQKGDPMKRRRSSGLIKPISPLCSISSPQIPPLLLRFSTERATQLFNKVGVVVENIGNVIWSTLSQRSH